MSKVKGTATRRTRKSAVGIRFEDGMVRISALTEFLNAQTSAIEAVCKKVAKEKADTSVTEQHIMHYLDGALQMADVTLDLLPPVRASALVDAINRYIDGLTNAFPQIVMDIGEPETMVLSYVKGSMKMANTIITALTNAPCTKESKATGSEVK